MKLNERPPELSRSEFAALLPPVMDKYDQRIELSKAGDSIIHAIAKYYLFPHSKNRSKYLVTIYQSLNKVYLLRHKKVPTAEFIFVNMYMTNEYKVFDLIEETMAACPKEEINPAYDLTALLDMIYKYLKWLASELNMSLSVEFTDVKSRIEELDNVHK